MARKIKSQTISITKRENGSKGKKHTHTLTPKQNGETIFLRKKQRARNNNTFQCASKCTISDIRSRKQSGSQYRVHQQTTTTTTKLHIEPKKLSLSIYIYKRHNKTCVHLLFQYCDCYYGDEGTD